MNFRSYENKDAEKREGREVQYISPLLVAKLPWGRLWDHGIAMTRQLILPLTGIQIVMEIAEDQKRANA